MKIGGLDDIDIDSEIEEKIPLQQKVNTEPIIKKILFLLFVHANLVMCNIIWGTMQVTNKWALENYFSPIVFSTVRFYTAIPFLLFVSIASLKWDIRKVLPNNFKDFILMAIFGISLGLQQAVYITGLNYTSASNTAVLGCLSPAFGLIFALVLKRERFYFFKLLGILFAVAGTLIIVDIFSMQFTMSALGDILVIISSVLVALNLLFQEYLSKLIGNSQQIVFWSIAIAAVELTIISLIFHFDEWKNVPEFPLEAWAPVVYAAVFATAFCYGMNGWCMKYTAPLIVISYMSIQPISATILEWLLGADLTLFFLIGSAFVIGGIFFVLFGRFQETRDLKKELLVHQDHLNNSDYSSDGSI